MRKYDPMCAERTLIRYFHRFHRLVTNGENDGNGLSQTRQRQRQKAS